jgi:hypothetical protein
MFFIRYSPMEYDLPKWDLQIELNEANLVGMFFGKRWYCCEGEAFRPFVKLAGGTYVSSKGELANFVDPKRWRVRGSVGIGQNFCSEIGVGYAVAGYDIFAMFGYNFDY